MTCSQQIEIGQLSPGKSCNSTSILRPEKGENRSGKDDKKPYFITTKDDGLFAFAGLWEAWSDKDNGTTTDSCTIITTDACKQIEHLHNRMPVILDSKLYDRWLDPDLVGFDVLSGILRDRKTQEFSINPGSKDVNSVRNNGPELIQAVDKN